MTRASLEVRLEAERTAREEAARARAERGDVSVYLMLLSAVVLVGALVLVLVVRVAGELAAVAAAIGS